LRNHILPITQVLAKLPQAELEQSLREFVAPLTELLPDQRLRRVVPLAVQGILAGQSPVVAAMAQSVSRQEADPWAQAKRVYRLLNNTRFSHTQLLDGLYRVAQHNVQREKPPYLVVAVDPVNFEKPYTEKLEGVSLVHKSTPPDLHGKARLTHGYPAITATIVNTGVPATTPPPMPSGSLTPLTTLTTFSVKTERLSEPSSLLALSSPPISTRCAMWRTVGLMTRRCLDRLRGWVLTS
jgi:hypothetical protein